MTRSLSQFCDFQKTRIKRRLASKWYFKRRVTQKEDRLMQEVMALADCDEVKRGDADVVFEYRRGLCTGEGMIKKLIVVVGMLLLAQTGETADLKPYLVMTLGQMSDTVVTYKQINRTVRPCSEANPLYGGPHPSLGKLIWPKAALIGGTSLLVWATRNHPSKGARWVAKGAAYLNGGIGGYAAYRNYQTCGW